MNLLDRATAIGVEGFMHCDELEKLVDLACNKNVLEVGSFKGLSAWGMAAVAKSLKCVDTFMANSAGQFQLHELTTLEDFKKATARFNNVWHFAGTSEQASTAIPGTFDMIFLDAMHTYEDVKADINRWWPRLVQGGTFAFHDYRHEHFPGVKQAVDERFGQLPNAVCTLGWLTKE